MIEAASFLHDGKKIALRSETLSSSMNSTVVLLGGTFATHVNFPVFHEVF
jgi:hypothetical protein